jgi:hypothetical protein
MNGEIAYRIVFALFMFYLVLESFNFYPCNQNKILYSLRWRHKNKITVD